MPDAKLSRFTPRPAAARLATAVAIVSGLFSLVVCILLIANYLQITALAPLDQPELLELRRQLAESPEADPVLVQQIRAMDLLARKAFFTSQAHLRMGGYLLLGGVAAFLVALKLAARWSPRIPAPAEGGAPEGHWTELARTRETIAFVSVVLVIVALLAAYFTPLDIPPATAAATAGASGSPAPGVEEKADPPMEFPDWEAVQEQWPSFRGPGGYGVARFVNAPVHWDGASGMNLRWKVPVPLPGFGSPVTWGKNVYLSGATEHVREVYCFDADTGDLRWKQTLPVFPGTPAEPPEVTEDTGYAAPTMAVHGDLAYAIFANGDIVCYDSEGTPRWGRNLGMPDNHYGHSSSLIAFGDLLYVQFDDKTSPRLMALRAGTGEEAWAVQREKISWASPACIPTPSGAALILCSERDVDAYDPATGGLLWSVACLDGEVAPSPAYAAETVFVANEYATATAIKLDAAGGALSAEIAWEWDEWLPEVASPVGTDKHFYITTSMGEVVCLDIATGEQVWFEEFDEGFYSSPILVGDRIYVFDRKGVAQIFGTGAQFERIGAPELGEAVLATPAYLDGRIYVRGEEHLFCIEQSDES